MLASIYLQKGCAVSDPAALKTTRSLRRRRQPSEDLRHQFEQWRRKSKRQEDMLMELERSNAAAQEAVAARAESDLRQVVRNGRALVRKWPLTTSSSILPMMKGNSRVRKPLHRTVAASASAPAPALPAEVIDVDVVTQDDCSRKGTLSQENETEGRSRSPNSAHAVFATVTRGQDELYSNRPRSAQSRVPTIESQAQNSANSRISVPTIKRELPRNAEGSVRANSKNTDEMTAEPSGWFWGAGAFSSHDSDRCDGSGCIEAGDAAPGEGTMSAYWGETMAKASSASVQREVFAPCAVIHTTDAAAVLPHKVSSSFRQASSRKIVAIGNFPSDSRCPTQGNDVETRHNSSSSGSGSHTTFIAVASAKAAVRSASNRAAELSRLLLEGKNPPREECLAKAESAARAAESAISCANERMFQLELMAAVGPDGRRNQEEGGTPEIAVVTMRQEYSGCGTICSSCPSSSLSAHIEQLAEQLKLAQSLQAASVTARARLARRFAMEDAAAVRLQGLARGCIERRSGRYKDAKEVKVARDAETNVKRLQDGEPVRSRLLDKAKAVDHNKQTATSDDTSLCFPRDSPPSDGRAEGFGDLEELDRNDNETLPRKADLWWTLAETECADELNDTESVLLKAIVKLQALARSRLARSKTFAAVNAGFVEHFDEEYQHPFYVCIETNTSQWNRPFGFGFERAGGRPQPSPSPFICGVVATEPAAANPTLPGDSTRSVERWTAQASNGKPEAVKGDSADAARVPELALLKAVVKLQALVRSRLARSKTFAAVNAGFVEHFDEEYQHPFYVCIETNTSQWNPPFGFGSRGENHGRGETSLPLPDRDHPSSLEENDTQVLHATETARRVVLGEEAAAKSGSVTRADDKAAAVVIQCAFRSARARGQLAEKIVLESL